MNIGERGVPRYSQIVVNERTVIPDMGRVQRISTGLPESEDLYETQDGYVKQLDDFSCAVASLVNAVWAIDGEVPDDMYEDLYREALTIHPRYNEQGIRLGIVHDIVNAYPESGISVRIPEGVRTLHPLLQFPIREEENAIKQSAKYIYDTINADRALEIALLFPDGSRHAEAVVGYQIDSKGFMLVQCIDSDGRPYLLPLEFVLLYLRPSGDAREDPAVIEIAYNKSHEIDVIEA